MPEEKKSTAKIVYPPELSGSDTLTRFDQGVYVNTYEKLAQSLQPKLFPMDYPQKVKGNKLVYYDEGPFSDTDLPTLLGGSYAILDYNKQSGNKSSTEKFSKFTTAPSMRWVDLEFGQSDIFQDGTAFDDQVSDLTDPVIVLNEDPDTIIVPASLVNIADEENIDGIIEPLDTRKYINRTIEVPFHSRGVWSWVGTIDAYRRSVFIENQYETLASRQLVDGTFGGTDPFLDGHSNVTTGSQGPETLLRAESQEFIHEADATIEPFVDTTDGILTSLQVSGSADFLSVVVSRMLSGSNLPGADYLRKDHVSLSRGFDYDNCEFGFDSRAYGGLLK